MPVTITPTPWLLGYASRAITTTDASIRLAMFGGTNHASNAEAVVTAINNTYGSGINAAVVPEMLSTLQSAAAIIWNYKYAEAIANGNGSATAQNYADNHQDYLLVKNTIAKATAL
jgi:hypothetical protein